MASFTMLLTYFTSFSSVSIVEFERVKVSWERTPIPLYNRYSSEIKEMELAPPIMVLWTHSYPNL